LSRAVQAITIKAPADTGQFVTVTFICMTGEWGIAGSGAGR
jgi:hypothetical protein